MRGHGGALLIGLKGGGSSDTLPEGLRPFRYCWDRYAKLLDRFASRNEKDQVRCRLNFLHTKDLAENPRYFKPPSRSKSSHLPRLTEVTSLRHQPTKR